MNVRELEHYLALLDEDVLVLVNGQHVEALTHSPPRTEQEHWLLLPCKKCHAEDRVWKRVVVDEVESLTLHGERENDSTRPRRWEKANRVRLYGSFRRRTKPRYGQRLAPGDAKTIRRLYERTRAELPPGLDSDVVELLTRLFP